jgi:hypothetical protein
MDTNQASFCKPESHQTDAKKTLPGQGLEQGSMAIIDARPGKLPEDSIKESGGPWDTEFPPGLSLAFCCDLAVQSRGGGFSRHGQPSAAE